MHYQKMKYKYWHDKNVKNAKLNTKIVNAILNIQFANDNLVIFRCMCYKRDYQKKFDKDTKKQFAKTYRFCNLHIKKFILMLQKGVYNYMDV